MLVAEMTDGLDEKPVPTALMLYW